MNLLYALEKIRTPILDEIMLFITKFGEETVFLAIVLILFWCIDKKTGYYLICVGFFGTIASQFLKLAFRIPRPWILDPDFTIVERARQAACGYSFPSGHSQSAVGTFGAIGAVSRQRWVKMTAIVIAALVPLSRMYLGVHTPADVLVGSGIALALVLFLKPMIYRKSTKSFLILLPVMAAVSAIYLIYVENWPFPSDMDASNMESGMKNAYTLLGAITGFCIVYVLDQKYIRFQTKAVWWVQILKFVFGLILTLAVRSLLKAPLDLLFGGHYIARSVHYFFVVLAAGSLWPLAFPYLCRLNRNHNNKNYCN